MKKLILAAAAALLTVTASHADTFNRGDLLGEVGIGVGARDWTGGGTAAFTQRVAVEYGVTKAGIFGVGVGFQVTDGLYSGNGYTSGDISMMPTASLHHTFATDLDCYATLGLGLGLANSRSHGTGYTEACFAMAFNIGARYWLTPALALNAQFGMPSAMWRNSYGSYNILSAGVTCKF